MRLGANVTVQGNDMKRFTEYVKRLEAVGIEHLWVPELYGADAISLMGYLAAITERATIGASILPIYTRTPSVLAMTAVGMDRVSGGRFILGLGASGPQVIEGFHGVPYDVPLSRTREILDICRSVWRRERLEHHGRSYNIPLAPGQGTGLGKPLKLVDHPVRADIPVFIASLGPKNVEMTAELADGWLPLHYWPDKAKDLWRGSVDAGLAKRDNALGPLEIVAGGPVAIGADLENLRDNARPMYALYFGGMGARGKNFYNDVLRGYGYEKEAMEIQDLYLSGRKDEAAALVPKELVDGMSLIGDPGFVRDRVAAYEDSGVTILNVAPAGPGGLRDIETLAGWLS